jgi:hypothetical protein
MLLEVKINHNNVYYKTDIDILLIKVHYVVAVSINQMWGHPPILQCTVCYGCFTVRFQGKEK